jgi:EPS-associated MarR family transcriptional regulator
MNEDTHYKVFKLLETNPEISQRELAKALGVSLGKANYCIGALIDKGLVKADNFKNSTNKRAYFYVLTPRGIEAKAKISVRFLTRIASVVLSWAGNVKPNCTSEGLLSPLPEMS